MLAFLFFLTSPLLSQGKQAHGSHHDYLKKHPQSSHHSVHVHDPEHVQEAHTHVQHEQSGQHTPSGHAGKAGSGHPAGYTPHPHEVTGKCLKHADCDAHHYCGSCHACLAAGLGSCGDCGHQHVLGQCWETDYCAEDQDAIDHNCPLSKVYSEESHPHHHTRYNPVNEHWKQQAPKPHEIEGVCTKHSDCDGTHYCGSCSVCLGKDPPEPCGDCGHPDVIGQCWDLENCALDGDGLDGTCPQANTPVLSDFHHGFLWGFLVGAVSLLLSVFWCNCIYHCVKRWRYQYRPLTQVELGFGLPDDTPDSVPHHTIGTIGEPTPEAMDRHLGVETHAI